MSVKTKASSTRKSHVFKLTIGFVDSSYWDDGNRSTSRTESFATRRARDARFKELVETRVIFTQGQEGDPHNFSVNWMQKIDRVEITRDYEMRGLR